MSTKKFIIFMFLTSVITIIGYAQYAPQINGYTQIRMETNYKSNPIFYIKRIKLWLTGKIAGDNNQEFLYKTQVFFSKTTPKPLLLDARLGYKYNNFTLWVGQQVVDYGRQTNKGDTKILMGDRARYYYTLTPDAEACLRDVGIQAFYKVENNGHISIGYFNGTFSNVYKNPNYSSMITNRFVYDVSLFDKGTITLDYSLMYRYANNLMFSRSLGTIPFSGKDLRGEFATELKIWKFDIETAYNYAQFISNTDTVYKASGYYLLFNTFVTNKDVVVLAIDQMDLPKFTSIYSSLPYYGIGYSHLFKGQKVKLTLYNWIHKLGYDNWDYITGVQFQMYIKTKK